MGHFSLPSGQQRIGAAGKHAILVLAIIALAGAIILLTVDGNGQAGDKTPANPGPIEATDPPEPVDYSLDGPLMQVLQFISREQFDQARARLALYEKDHAKSVQSAFLQGLSYHKEKRYAQARPYFERAIEIDEGYAPSWYFLGWCLYYLGELDAARERFTHHLTMDPLEGDSHFGIGLVEIDQGNLDDARVRFLKAIELQENNPRRQREVAKSHARLGDVYSMQDDLDRAKAELEKATQMWPGHYEAFFKLARVLYRLGEDEAAEEAMARYEEGKRIAQGVAPIPQPSDDGALPEAPVEESP